MLDRRNSQRRRVYYGGRIAFNDRQSTIDCIVRNMSSTGALIECPGNGPLPKQVDLIIHTKETAFLATKIWQRDKLCGFTFQPAAQHTRPTLDIALRQRAYERANNALRLKIQQLSGFG